MADRKYYVLCDQNCKFESLTKEQILTAIEQAVNEGTIADIDTGFITTLKTINGVPLKFFAGTQSEYDALTEAEKENLVALITNDTTEASINAAIEELRADSAVFNQWKSDVMNGGTAVPKATNADHADHATNATNATKATHATNATRATNANYATTANALRAERVNLNAAISWTGGARDWMEVYDSNGKWTDGLMIFEWNNMQFVGRVRDSEVYHLQYTAQGFESFRWKVENGVVYVKLTNAIESGVGHLHTITYIPLDFG